MTLILQKPYTTVIFIIGLNRHWYVIWELSRYLYNSFEDVDDLQLVKNILFLKISTGYKQKFDTLRFKNKSPSLHARSRDDFKIILLLLYYNDMILM